MCKKKVIPAAVVIASLAIGLAFGYLLKLRNRALIPAHLSVIFPSLTEGRCVLIQTPEGKNLMIDAGAAGDLGSITRLLAEHGVATVDLLVLTSNTESSLGSLPQLLAGSIPIRSVWMNAIAGSTLASQHAVLAIHEHQVPIRMVHSGDMDEIGPSETRLSILWPPQAGPYASQDPLVCRVDYANVVFIIGGTSSSASEPNMVSEDSEKLSCGDNFGVLQVANPSKFDGTSAELLRWTTPEIAVVSIPTDQTVAPGVLHRLGAAGAEVWRTDRQGTVTVTSDGQHAPIVSAPNT